MHQMTHRLVQERIFDNVIQGQLLDKIKRANESTGETQEDRATFIKFAQKLDQKKLLDQA